MGTKEGIVPPLETTIESMENTSRDNLPAYRSKKWCSDHSGLEFVIATTIPELPPNFDFDSPKQGEANEIVRCITADVLQDQYGVAAPPGNEYSAEENWWLLVTALDTNSPVVRTTLLLCLGNLSTVVDTTSSLCFLPIDHIRGKFTCHDCHSTLSREQNHSEIFAISPRRL